MLSKTSSTCTVALDVIGRFAEIEVTEGKLSRITLLDEGAPDGEVCSVARQFKDELALYCEGELEQFTVPFNLEVYGSEFQQRVWRELTRIPYGEVISYKRLAENVGGANYSRAVANANGKNPLPIIVPCHRVISSDGSIGGYTGGVEVKEQLLDLEGVRWI